MYSVHVLALSEDLFEIDKFQCERRERERWREREKKKEKEGTLNTFSQRTRQRLRLITHLAMNRESTTMTTSTHVLRACAAVHVYGCTTGDRLERLIRSFDQSFSLYFLTRTFSSPFRESIFFHSLFLNRQNGIVRLYSSFSSIFVLHTHDIFRESKHKNR